MEFIIPLDSPETGEIIKISDFYQGLTEAAFLSSR